MSQSRSGRKTTQGELITTVVSLYCHIAKGNWIYLGDKPIHPAVVYNWKIKTAEWLLSLKLINEAIDTKTGDHYRDYNEPVKGDNYDSVNIVMDESELPEWGLLLRRQSTKETVTYTIDVHPSYRVSTGLKIVAFARDIGCNLEESGIGSKTRLLMRLTNCLDEYADHVTEKLIGRME